MDNPKAICTLYFFEVGGIIIEIILKFEQCGFIIQDRI